MNNKIAVEAPRRITTERSAHSHWLPNAVTRLIFGRPLAPDNDEWQAIIAATQTGDAEMDRVVNWMFEESPGQRKKLFEQALTQGIGSLEEPPEPLLRFFSVIDQDPPWLDRELMEQGIAASHLAGNTSFYVLRDMALMGGYAYFNSANQTLAAAGSLTSKTSLRLGETGKWLMDVTEPGGMSRFGNGFITTIRVRMVHALVRRNLLQNRQWDTSTWGVPINQADMTATYLAFGPVTISGVRMFGVPVDLKQSKAAMHMWRYIGWLSGVEERWLALSERDGWRKLYHTFLTHGLPDEKIAQLGRALRQEPLQRYLPGLARYPRLTRLKQKYLYHLHLSNSAAILGPLQRKQLGLPLWILPWYPLVSAPWRFTYLMCLKLRGGKPLARYAKKCREQQRALLDAYFAEKPKQIIDPDKDHPAHVAME
ncbi:MAG: oxygenase MpaB family protein [Ketobacteraceae bacterium]|nr:oxygenase MpaB family protein [Ketobacteraceae bacterium]